MKPPALRLFLAVMVPERVREELRRLQDELRRHLPGEVVRWTNPAQIHLTLHFLGNVEAAQVGQLTEAVRLASEPFGPMRLRAERIGFFPQALSPRVIWAWVHDDFGDLVRLQKALAAECAPFGQPPEEKGFTGHLTLGRIGRLPAAQARSLGELAVTLADRVHGDWTARHVTLMRSEPGGNGSRYNPVEEFALRS
jgi:2'-5' RNA ligase